MGAFAPGANTRSTLRYDGFARQAAVPHDSHDVGRCVKLLSLFPEWREWLDEVGDSSPQWRMVVDNWAELERRWWDGEKFEIHDGRAVQEWRGRR